MTVTYAGVDIGGEGNTWLALLEPVNSRLRLAAPPCCASLRSIVGSCETGSVLAMAIDAQLTGSVERENGFRLADNQLRSLLPPDCQAWVASLNSLMAVPARGRLLTDAVAALVGTILETHPRASLLLALGMNLKDPICRYKRRRKESAAAYRDRGGQRALEHLWQTWCERFDIETERPVTEVTDGQLDALVSGTTAALYHRDPEKLLRLSAKEDRVIGRGPFYVLREHDGWR